MIFVFQQSLVILRFLGGFLKNFGHSRLLNQIIYILQHVTVWIMFSCHVSLPTIPISKHQAVRYGYLDRWDHGTQYFNKS